MAMKLSVGKIAFPIEFDNGDKDVIYFNPNDPDLATRLMTAISNINERISCIEEPNNIENPLRINDNAGIVDSEELEKVNATIDDAEKFSYLIETSDKIVREELDGAFSSNVSAVIFKHCSPFAVINGKYYLTTFLEAILPEVQKNISKSMGSVDENMMRYIRKYTKNE